MSEIEQLRGEVANLKEMVRRLSLRVQHGVRPARQSENATETNVIQGVRVAHNTRETRDLMAMQMYGFASSTLPGTDHFTVQIAGDNSNGISIASNHQAYRPQNLAPGAVRIYNNAGSYVHMEGNKITLVAQEVDVTSPLVHLSGDLTVDGDVTAKNISFTHHKHNEHDGPLTSYPVNG